MLVEAEIWSVVQTDQGPAVLVRPKDGEVAVPIFIDQTQAHSLLIGMGNAPMYRPMTHDLMKSIFEKLGATVERVEITTISATTFYSQLILKKGEERMSFDSRPSDSISLAVRFKCPIFIAESVVDTAGVPLSAFEQADEKEETEPEALKVSLPSLRNELEVKLKKAVDDEDYELAAKIRDEIAELESSSSSETDES